SRAERANLWRRSLREMVSVPPKAAELTEIDVPAAQHTRDSCTWRRFDETLQECSDRSGGRAFGHQLGVRHDPDDGLEDLLVWQRAQIVDVIRDDLERLPADALHAETVDDAIDPVEGHEPAFRDASRHGRRSGRFDPHDPDRRVAALERGRDARD